MKVKVKHVEPYKKVWMCHVLDGVGTMNNKIILLNQKKITHLNEHLKNQIAIINQLNKKLTSAYTKLGKQKTKSVALDKKKERLACMENALNERETLITSKEIAYNDDKNRWIKDHLPLCIACNDNPREYKFSGCPHVVYCGDCMLKSNTSRNGYKCPICSMVSGMRCPIIFS